jgi:putative salt-induced outer membrane protein YdiY
MSPLLALALSVASAAEPAYDGTADAAIEAEKPVTALKAELGASFTSGNAFSFSAAGGFAGSHTWGSNQFTFGGGVNLNFNRVDTDADGTVADEDPKQPLVASQERFFGLARYDRFIGKENALYISGNAERDRLAGLLWRFNEQFGYRRLLVATDATKLDLEIGLAYSQENFVASDDGTGTDTIINDGVLDAHYLAARLFLGFEHKFNDAVVLGDSIEFFQNLSNLSADNVDSRLINSFFVTANVSDRFAIKISHRLAFDNVPAGTEYAKLDQTTMLTLVATIF